MHGDIDYWEVGGGSNIPLTHHWWCVLILTTGRLGGTNIPLTHHWWCMVINVIEILVPLGTVVIAAALLRPGHEWRMRKSVLVLTEPVVLIGESVYLSSQSQWF